MNTDFSKLKELNSKLKKGKANKLLYIIAIFISAAIVLLIINSDAFLSLAVILIFFAIIMSMISFFISIISKQKIFKQRIKNSIFLLYPQIVNTYNNTYVSDFQVTVKSLESSKFKLFPDYCEFENLVSFFDEQSNIKSHFIRLYINGREGRVTPVFNGSYVIIPFSSSINFYYERLYGAFEHLTKIVSKRPTLVDESIPKLFKKKKEFLGGQLSIEPNQELPHQIIDVIKMIKKNHANDSFRIGIHKNDLHISIQSKHTYPPYVKKYKENEKDVIEDFVWSILKDLSDITNIFNL
jgi:hypothetical protein